MQKIIMTKGLPGSGKSTWSKNLMKENPGQFKRVNKDDLRLMIDDNFSGKDTEKFILVVRDSIIEKALSIGKSVIVDDTNFNPFHEKILREIAEKFNCEFVIEDFTNISIEECILRDSKRVKPVGEIAIRKMYERYLQNQTN